LVNGLQFPYEIQKLEDSMVNEEIHERVLPHTLDDTWEEEDRRHRLRVRAFGVVAILAALAAVVWYVYPGLAEHPLSFAQFTDFKDALANGSKAQIADMKGALVSAGNRIDAADKVLSDMVKEWDGLRSRISMLEGRVTSNIQAARKQTRELIAQQQQKLQADVDSRTQGLQARVTRIESGQESQQTRVARLEQELAEARQENARQAALLQQDRDRVDHALTNLDQRVEGDKQELAAVHSRIDRQRVDFEAGINHSRELAPGITLQVNRTNVGYQRFEGWVFLMPDRRTIWVRDQGVQRPVEFYSREDGRSRELVITRVTKYSVVGYLLLPESKG
jgi:predicted  nucleic acid-binding Zn-ribbon protein